MTPVRQRTRLDPDERREQILSAAHSLFAHREYSDVSVEDLATEAGVTRGLLHHYFGSKRALYLEVVERAVTVPSDVAIIPAGSSGSLADVVDASVESWMHMVEVAGGLFAGAPAQNGLADHDVDDVVTRARDDLVERMVAELPVPADVDHDLLRSALRGYAALARVTTAEWLIAHNLTREQTATLLRETLLALLQDIVPAMR